ncbi:tape measure protein [Clostridium sp. D46t1_190503_E9]|uniref:tape measure protein n=1 Tax=Clostridium sp. D46t1_190503_E9 TaxID=2787137 RepID=UPI0018986ECD|nr:tape measure protein [Clostridium sp. D46t1_190503_E9]
MADGRIIIDTEINSSGAEKDVKGLSGKLSSIAKTGLTAFTGLVTASGAAIGGLATIATKYNSQMEDYFANFTVLLGSATEATKHVEDLKDFAAKTPFEMTGLADASKQLLSFGIGVEDIMPDLQMLGDISLGNQERFKGLALVFAQVASAGKLTGQDLMQFINQGFNPLQSIAEKTGKSMSELKEEMSDGKISYEMVAEAMKSATSEGGKFYQGMEVQSKTLSGMWSTLKDDTMSLIGDAFKPFSEILKSDVMPTLQGMVVKMSEAFKDPNIQASIANIADGLGDFAVKIGELISDYLPKIIEGFAWLLDNSNEIATGIIAIGTALMVLNVANMIMGLVKAFQAFKLANEGATVAQWLLNVAMSANPIGIVIAAIAGLIAGIVYLWNTNEGFRTAIINAWNAIKEAGILVWDWLVNFFTVDIPNAWNSVVAFFSGVPAWFGELWNTIKQAFIDGWQAITDFFTITIPSWIEQIFNWFNELPYKIGFALGNLLGTIVKWGTDTWNYLTTNVPIWIENVVTFFSELPGRIWTWLVNAYNNIVRWGKDTWNNMYTTASNAVSAVIDWFASLPGKIWSWLLSTISKVYQFGRDLGSKASEAGSNMVSNIINAVTNLPSKMAEIGSNIVRGVWNGITGMGSWIASKVSGFFSGIVDGAKAALGIHSPSRVFRDQVGKYMAQGVGVGFEDETDNVQKSMDDDFKNLVAKMQGTVDYETAMTTARVVAHNNNLGGVSDTDNDDNPKNNPVTVVAKFIVDGKEFTQTVVAPNQDVLTEYYEGR